MAHVSTYLNFPGTTAEAFEFYRSVFGTEYLAPVMRMGDMPPEEGQPPLPEHLAAMVMHVSLPITGGHVLMGTDAVEELGHAMVKGTNVNISVYVDTREEADQLYAALADGGTGATGMTDMFWGYWGSVEDRFGTRWMVNHAPEA